MNSETKIITNYQNQLANKQNDLNGVIPGLKRGKHDYPVVYGSMIYDHSPYS
jgi:hypothetical protein